MPLTKMSPLLAKARNEKYAIGSFSVANMEMVLGVLKAVEETKSPAIIQIAEVRLKQSPLELIGPLMVAAAKNCSMPVAVHFDHGKTKEKIQQALDIGFTSVMFDGSHLPFEENAAVTSEIKKTASLYNADCEGEIGCVGGSEDGSEDIAVNCTSPEQAKEFYEKTCVDALAVAIGNAHGNYKQAPKLRFDILEKTAPLVKVPLVLHGGTGILPDDFRKCISLGINKINIATATFDSVQANVRKCYTEGAINGYYDLQAAEVEGAYLNAMKHIEIFGCAGKGIQ
ncbi:MAG: class II aldolase [Clostridia bacterium]|nr:class II aldolase [Clostridia bacterium]